MTGRANRPITGFEGLADALNRHAARLARARAAARRAKDRQLDAKWRSPRLLWPDLAEDN